MIGSNYYSNIEKSCDKRKFLPFTHITFKTHILVIKSDSYAELNKASSYTQI